MSLNPTYGLALMQLVQNTFQYLLPSGIVIDIFAHLSSGGFLLTRQRNGSSIISMIPDFSTFLYDNYHIFYHNNGFGVG